MFSRFIRLRSLCITPPWHIIIISDRAIVCRDFHPRQGPHCPGREVGSAVQVSKHTIRCNIVIHIIFIYGHNANIMIRLYYVHLLPSDFGLPRDARMTLFRYVYSAYRTIAEIRRLMVQNKPHLFSSLPPHHRPYVPRSRNACREFHCCSQRARGVMADICAYIRRTRAQTRCSVNGEGTVYTHNTNILFLHFSPLRSDPIGVDMFRFFFLSFFDQYNSTYVYIYIWYTFMCGVYISRVYPRVHSRRVASVKIDVKVFGDISRQNVSCKHNYTMCMPRVF